MYHLVQLAISAKISKRSQDRLPVDSLLHAAFPLKLHRQAHAVGDIIQTPKLLKHQQKTKVTTLQFSIFTKIYHIYTKMGIFVARISFTGFEQVTLQ